MRCNDTGRYEQFFPYLSPCGRENNYIRCDDVPIVFTNLLPGLDGNKDSSSLIYNHSKLAIDFQPQKLFMASNGRLYHPGPERLHGIGLVKSQMAITFSQDFTFDEQGNPTHFTMKNDDVKINYKLDQSLKNHKIFSKKH